MLPIGISPAYCIYKHPPISGLPTTLISSITSTSSPALINCRNDGDGTDGESHSGCGEGNDFTSRPFRSISFGFAEQAHDDTGDFMPPPLDSFSAESLSSPIFSTSTESSDDDEEARWLEPCRGNLPGATPLEGVIPRSLEEVDSAVSFGFEREQRDHVGISKARVHRHLVEWQRQALVGQIDLLSKITLRDSLGDTESMSCDTVSLAVMTLMRFLGSTTEQEPLTDEELLWLPAACVSAAYKVRCNHMTRIM